MLVQQNNLLALVVALLISLSGATPGSVRADAPPPSNLLINGSFSAKDATGHPAGWTVRGDAASVTMGADGDSPFVTLRNTQKPGTVSIEQIVPLQPEWAKILLRGSIRVADRPAGGLTGTIGIRLTWAGTGDAAKAPPVVLAPDTFDGNWADINQILDIPKGAMGLTVSATVSNPASIVDFHNLTLVAWVPTLVDEFDGSSVDMSHWTPTDTDNFVYTPGIAHFSPDHVSVANGVATFHADKVPIGAYAYQSGELTTIDKFQQLYGYFEFRVKLPLVIGVWPAAYLIKWDNSWPPEIDVQEMSGNDMKTVIETNHYADDYGRHKSSQRNFDGTTVDRGQWHTYAVAWEPNALAWYFDGKYMGTTGPPDAGVSDVPMYIRMNLGVGAYGGDPEQSTWPQDYVCDFVHVYQRHDFPLPLYQGSSQEITLPTNSVDLHAISCSPPGGETVTWSLTEGPGKASIADPHSLDTKATLTKPGMYRFSVVASKGRSSASREVLVYVNPEAGRS